MEQKKIVTNQIDALFLENFIKKITLSGTNLNQIDKLMREKLEDKSLVEHVCQLENIVIKDIKKWAQELNNNTQAILDNYYNHIAENGTTLSQVQLDRNRLSFEERGLFSELSQFDQALIEQYEANDEACMREFNFDNIPELEKTKVGILGPSNSEKLEPVFSSPLNQITIARISEISNDSQNKASSQSRTNYS